VDTIPVRQIEMPANGSGACARGMAILAAAMANKGKKYIMETAQIMPK